MSRQQRPWFFDDESWRDQTGSNNRRRRGDNRHWREISVEIQSSSRNRMTSSGSLANEILIHNVFSNVNFWILSSSTMIGWFDIVGPPSVTGEVGGSIGVARRGSRQWRFKNGRIKWDFCSFPKSNRFSLALHPWKKDPLGNVGVKNQNFWDLTKKMKCLMKEGWSSKVWPENPRETWLGK